MKRQDCEDERREAASGRAFKDEKQFEFCTAGFLSSSSLKARAALQPVRHVPQ